MTFALNPEDYYHTGIVVPDGMVIEFLEATRSGTVDAYERMARYMDQQISLIVLGETLRARHELDVRVPEARRIGAVLDQLGGAPGDLAIGHRAMAEDVAQAVAEAIADLGDLLVGRPAVRAVVAAVLDQGDLCRRGAEDVVDRFVDRTVEPVVCRCLGHSGSVAVARAVCMP